MTTSTKKDGIHIDQLRLITAINAELCRQHSGLEVEARHFNAVIAAENSICAAFLIPVVKASEGMGIIAWLASDDTGSSSLYMSSVLSGKPGSYSNHYPRDPADFGRCMRLIKAVPSLKADIGKMADHGKQWKAVAENWDTWCQLYEGGDGSTLYDAMQAAYEEPR